MLDLMFPHAVVMEDFTASIVVLTLVFMPVSAFVMVVEICVQTVPASEEMPVQQVLSVPLISETFVLKLVPRVDKAVLMVVWIAVQWVVVSLEAVSQALLTACWYSVILAFTASRLDCIVVKAVIIPEAAVSPAVLRLPKATVPSEHPRSIG